MSDQLTRERWLAHRVLNALDRDGLDPEHSPATKVWACIEAEIKRWMDQHGIRTGLPTMHKEQNRKPSARERGLIPHGRNFTITHE